MKPLAVVTVLLALILAGLALQLLRGEVGASFFDEEDLMAYEKSRGFVSVGRFPAPQWPAKIAEVKSSEGKVKFQLADGTLQQYAGFDGYKLKVVTVRPENGPVGTYVFRSEKPSGDR